SQVDRNQRYIDRQARTDSIYTAESAGFMDMRKTYYRSRIGDFDIPVWVFQPLEIEPDKKYPAIVWVHENIRGHLYEHYISYIKRAVATGYIIVAPEYRGSWGYSQELYDAIDYGGNEVDDVLTSVDYIRDNLPHVDLNRLGIIGWSHGGMISLLSIFREQFTFKAAVAMVPVTNLFQRLAFKGVERQYGRIDPQGRIGGLPHERRDEYKERSPYYNVDKLEIPLLVHITENDGDVNYEEAVMLIDALRARKPNLSVTKIYKAPDGGHTFDRKVDQITWEPVNNPEQRDSWNRIWNFFDWHLEPFK
ncbi:alpha/beta hydrolase family protein, partial [candidate division KSB1 bacterium]